MHFYFHVFSATIYPQMKSVVSFFSEVKSELFKVTWPKRNEVIRLTSIVILVSLVVGLLTGGLDAVFTKLLANIVTK